MSETRRVSFCPLMIFRANWTATSKSRRAQDRRQNSGSKIALGTWISTSKGQYVQGQGVNSKNTHLSITTQGSIQLHRYLRLIAITPRTGTTRSGLLPTSFSLRAVPSFGLSHLHLPKGTCWPSPSPSLYQGEVLASTHLEPPSKSYAGNHDR